MAKSKEKPMGIEAPEDVAEQPKPVRQTAPLCANCGKRGVPTACVATSTQGVTTYYKCPTCKWTTKKAKPIPRLKPEDKPPPTCPYCDQPTEFSREHSNGFKMVFHCVSKGCTGYSQSRYRSNMTKRVEEADAENDLSAR